MKNILLILLTIITFNCYSQVIVEIPEDELEEVFLAIDTLKQQDKVKSILIFDLESQIRNYEMLSKQDSMILDYRLQQVKLLNEQIKLYDDRLRKVDKWYKKPWVGVVGGVVGTLITIHVIDYSLPK
jgi:predicted Zn-dependent peptidase